jgi:hypothetical protein
MRKALASFLLAAFVLASPAAAQRPDDVPTPVQTPNLESIQIGLSTNRVAITADFSGADLTIFGALDNRFGKLDVSQGCHAEESDQPRPPTADRRRGRAQRPRLSLRAPDMILLSHYAVRKGLHACVLIFCNAVRTFSAPNARN